MSTLEKRYIPRTAMSAVLGGAVVGGLGFLIAGPPGLAVGAVIGVATGALVGHKASEAADPGDSVGHFKEIYTSMPYYEAGMGWSDYEPAYRFGLETWRTRGGQTFDEAGPALGARWLKIRGGSRLTWGQAGPAVDHVWREMEETVREQGPAG